MIQPKVVDDKKGAGSFRIAGGKGYVELVCEGNLPDISQEVKYSITIGSGKKRQPLRGPITHNFAEMAVSKLPKGQALWDFNHAVDKDSSTFVVCLEILPVESEVQAASKIPEDAAPIKPGQKRW